MSTVTIYYDSTAVNLSVVNGTPPADQSAQVASLTAQVVALQAEIAKAKTDVAKVVADLP